MDFGHEIDAYRKGLTDTIGSLDKSQINDVINTLMEAYDRGSNIFIFGNGGSAATASHFVCDFNKGVSAQTEKKFRFVCLNDNVPTLMAIANDCGYENVFSMQLEGKLSKGDLVFAISGSGNSKNVIKAVEYAKTQGNEIISLTGYKGGKLLGLSDHPIHVNIEDMQKVEDVHMMLDHMMSQIIAKKFGHLMC
jgi:D-sedoheptulose 7-phosphate isomerase